MKSWIAALALFAARGASGETNPPPPDSYDVKVPEPGTFGAACPVNDACNSGWCIESPGGKVCTQTCLEECPGGWHCSPFAGGGADLVFICTPLGLAGAKCDSKYDCKSGWCLASSAGAVCVDPCGPGCPDGSSCQVVAEAGTSLCLPSGAPTPGSFGDTCSHDYDCGSQLCVKAPNGQECSTSCSGSECPAGWKCEYLTNGLKGCVPLKDTGDKCQSKAECKGGYCLQATGGATICTEDCDAPCANGWPCESVGDVAVCLEPGAPLPLTFGDPCEGDTQCLSGYCQPGIGSYQCSATCDGGCPEGSSCQPGWFVPVHLCLPNASTPEGDGATDVNSGSVSEPPVVIIGSFDTSMDAGGASPPESIAEPPADVGSGSSSFTGDGGCSTTHRGAAPLALLLLLWAVCRLSYSSGTSARPAARR